MTDYKGKRFCVLGDSISTFSGYTPEEAVFYNSYMQRMTGVTDVNLTWWMQVINHFGGVLASTTPTPAAPSTAPAPLRATPMSAPRRWAQRERRT